MIRIGTRKSQLAVAQAELIANEITNKLGMETEIIKITSLGDKDQISKLTNFRGQGVFTSSLERSLANREIDVAVHSLKDLPVNVRPDLPIVAYYKRHSPGDSLLIKEELVISEKPLRLQDDIRVATGSPRRQSQFLERFPTAVAVDIRGNVHTRASRLRTKFVDGLIMATAVFDRINLELPPGIIRIDLDPTHFPPAAGQASIAVQVRRDEYSELSQLNHGDTETAVLTEREILESVGGGCELSLAAYVTRRSRTWNLYSSFAPLGWVAGEKTQLSRFMIERETPEELIQLFKEYYNSKHQIEQVSETSLDGKIIALAKDHDTADSYYTALSQKGATVVFNPILRFVNNWSVIKDQEVIQKWEKAEWVVVSSQRAVPVLKALTNMYDLPKRYAVVGSKTASVMRKYDFPVHIVGKGNMDDLKKQLADARQIYPGNVFYARGDKSQNYPSKDCYDAEFYQTKTLDFDLELKPHYLVVYSSRSAELIIDQKGEGFADTWVAIGSSTYDTLGKFSCKTIQAKTPSVKGVVDAILEDYL